MRVSVFGLGYVGCVTAASLAKAGHQVIGVDLDGDKVDRVQAGASPVIEPGLDALIAGMVAAGRLTATRHTVTAIRNSEIAMICVGTPGHPNGQLGVGAIERVSLEIGRALARRIDPFTVVLRSTVLPGTTERVMVPALGAPSGMGTRPGPAARLAVNPEFMREGVALHDFAHPPFTLVGCAHPETASRVAALYKGLDAPLVTTTLRAAEMVKYACNAFHALKIDFANEIGDVCTALGADAGEVMRIFKMDTRLNISSAYLRPGFAFGGSCLPKDLRALLYAARRADLQVPLLEAILPANEAQIRTAIRTVLQSRRRRIGVVGLSFKPGTDDLRESPMVTLVEALIGKGCDVRILDGNVSIARLVGANRRYIEEEIPHIASLMCADAGALLEHAEVVVIGSAGEEAESVLAGVRPSQEVVDLTREAPRRRESSERMEGVR
ncbi:MAG TPA: nucleotide sugar dehydrogenase [Patescibacteria group bacterium]|nr:nucleotide sugar dehydrogenase [Patescibacteria group bacterium]